jgi:deoxyribonuclease V
MEESTEQGAKKRDPFQVVGVEASWPETEDELVEVQRELGYRAKDALTASPWAPGPSPRIGGAFVAFASAERDNPLEAQLVWASAVVWSPANSPFRRGGESYRKSDQALRGSSEVPRRALDVEAQVVVAGRVSAPYRPGLLALRQGPILAKALSALEIAPDVLVVDATGTDHPRRAGLALHLGAFLDVPSVGVTQRPLLAVGDRPLPVRCARSPVTLDGELVGYWVTTRPRSRPVLAHAAWRTSAETAAEVALVASTPAARTPVPLQEARRVAREAREAHRAAMVNHP